MFHCTRVKERRLSVRTIVISLLSVVEKIYTEILVDRVRRVTGGLIYDEQGGFWAEKGCVDQIFALKQIGEKERDKKRLIDLEKE